MNYRPSIGAGALALALPLLSVCSACGATIWVDGLLATPTSHIGHDPTEITDQTFTTGWRGVYLAEGEALTLTWSIPVFNDGTGIITVTGEANLYPVPSNLAFDVRLRLSDGSYTAPQTIASSSGVREIDRDLRKFVSRQTLNIASLYDGPLGVTGIEFTNLNPYMMNGDTPAHGGFNLLGVSATVPIPEPSAVLLSLAGAAVFAGRRKRRQA